MVYCCSRATLGSPLTVCIPPAACQVEPQVSSPRSISSASFQPALVRWYRTLAPTTPPPITTTLASLFTDPPLLASLVGHGQLHGRTRAHRARPEALDQPGAEQRDRRIAQAFRVRDEVVAITVIERHLERLDQTPGADLFRKQVSVDQRQPRAAERVLHGEHRRVEHQAAFD